MANIDFSDTQSHIISKRKPRRRSSERTGARGFVVLSKRADANGTKEQGVRNPDQIQMMGSEIS